MLSIRDAVADDWPSIWPIVEAVVEVGDTYCWPPDTSEGAAREWWIGKPGGRVFLAEESGDVLGTAELHPNQPGPGSHVANAACMVSPHAGRRGVGRALATHVLGAAVSDGYRAMQFNAVVETNTAAVRLWLSLGFRVGTVPEAFAHPVRGLVGLHLMHRPLASE